MKLLRRYRRAPDMTRGQLLDALRDLARNLQIEHRHTIRHEPIPPPQRGTVVFKRPDGSESFRYAINCGRGAYSRVVVPKYAIDPDAGPNGVFEMEFQWDR